MARKKLQRTKGLAILMAGRVLARYLPIYSLSVSNWLFSLFCSNKTAVLYPRGHKVIVLPGVASCWRDIVTGREYAVQKFLSNLATEATGLLDCGANIGYFSCLVARMNPRAKIVAVEPLPECQSYLRAICRINNFPNIECVPAVLSDNTGTHRFELPEQRFGESGGLGRMASATTVKLVEGYSLESLLQMFAVEDRVIVKVDIEGFEAVALHVPLSSQNMQKIIALCVEVHLYQFSEPWTKFNDLLESVQAWFSADWFVDMPRCLQSPMQRYWNRISQREDIVPLDRALIEDLIKNEQIADLHLFAIRKAQ